MATQANVKTEYRGYVIGYWAKPIPDRRFDWEAHHEDADPPVVTCYGRTLDECKADIDRDIEEAGQ